MGEYSAVMCVSVGSLHLFILSSAVVFRVRRAYGSLRVPLTLKRTETVSWLDGLLFTSQRYFIFRGCFCIITECSSHYGVRGFFSLCVNVFAGEENEMVNTLFR